MQRMINEAEAKQIALEYVRTRESGAHTASQISRTAKHVGNGNADKRNEGHPIR